MTAVVVAEKPSVARDIAHVLGARTRREGYISGNGYIVTWAVGHLVTLPEPKDIHDHWRRWSRQDLPLIPDKWPLVVIEKTRSQYEIICRLLGKKGVKNVICATDAGREGELIFRYIYEKSGCRLPVQRLWISSLTEDAISRGFKNLKPGSAVKLLGDAAKARSRADWLVGMNLSRAYSLQHDDKYSVGRVQTPTLAMLAAREVEIRDFVPEDYWHVKGDFQKEVGAGKEGVLKDAMYFRPPHRRYKSLKAGDYRPHRFDSPEGEAAELVAGLADGKALVVHVSGKEVRQKAPLLYDLTELQRRCNRLYGLPAASTLAIAQSLYEKHKLISYPRTDSRYLTQSVAAQICEISGRVMGPYKEEGLYVDPSSKPLAARFIDDSKAKEHHALIPTGKAKGGSLTQDESRVYDLIVRRLLAAWQPDYVSAKSYVVLEVAHKKLKNPLFFSSGVQVLHWGYKEIERERKREEKRLSPLPSFLKEGEAAFVKKVAPQKKTTQPPPRMNDASLLTAMESAGRSLDDKELKGLMREQGLGTAATRAGIIDTLMQRGFINRENKAFYVTQKGLCLIDVVDPKVKTPEMTALWEARFRDIESGKLSLDDFMAQIASHVTELSSLALKGEIVKNKAAPGAPSGAAAAVAAAAAPRAKTPAQGAAAAAPMAAAPRARAGASKKLDLPKKGEKVDLDALLKSAFGFDRFRPHQKKVCEEVYEGMDLLLVMPTGAGKSLCYQLPGLARGGVTLVISPLIALIEDQVAKLRAGGHNAERIHSGLSRAQSMDICRSYVAGSLDFLFVAPERLGIPQFLDLLSNYKPSLIAIDEAHCISQWGHDFRPDYRLLSERLPRLRPAPIVALTATATPLVQKDIATELGLMDPSLHIRGFRRDNIAIETVEMPVNRRVDALMKILADPKRRPAIVYASSRALSEQVADALSEFGAKAYHAGLAGEERHRVQEDFLSGRIDIVAATVAFGMGVDKADIRTVVHVSLPSSVEGYYQEIGRAGRDGGPSRAVLFHSFADYRTQDWFLNRNYPEVDYLKGIIKQVPKGGIFKQALDAKGEPDVLENAIEKLWIHGGLKISPEEFITLGDKKWQAKYQTQREHREEQIQNMGRLAKTHDVCRMLMLVQYFGDENDSFKPCGSCDVCHPEGSFFRVAREPDDFEMVHMEYLISYLYEKGAGLSKGKVFKEVFEFRGVTKDTFEAWTAALVSAGFLALVESSFSKGGRTINYWKMVLAPGFSPVKIPWEKVRVPDFGKEVSSQKKRQGALGRGAKTKTKRRAAATASPAAPAAAAPYGADSELTEKIMGKLREWRLKEARKRKIPAFCILAERSMRQIAEERPQSETALGGIVGIGPTKIKKYASDILRILSL